MFRIPAGHPASLRCLRSAVPPLHPRFAPAGMECDAGGRGFSRFRSGYPCPDLGWRRQGLPGSWGTHARACPALRPRRDRKRQAIAASRCGLPPPKRRRLPQTGYFRGSITRPTHSLSTLRRVDHSTATQDSLPAAGQALPGGTGYPLGSNERFQLLHRFPLSQASPGAIRS